MPCIYVAIIMAMCSFIKIYFKPKKNKFLYRFLHFVYFFGLLFIMIHFTSHVHFIILSSYDYLYPTTSLISCASDFDTTSLISRAPDFNTTGYRLYPKFNTTGHRLYNTNLYQPNTNLYTTGHRLYSTSSDQPHPKYLYWYNDFVKASNKLNQYVTPLVNDYNYKPKGISVASPIDYIHNIRSDTIREFNPVVTYNLSYRYIINQLKYIDYIPTISVLKSDGTFSEMTYHMMAPFNAIDGTKFCEHILSVIYDSQVFDSYDDQLSYSIKMGYRLVHRNGPLLPIDKCCSDPFLKWYKNNIISDLFIYLPSNCNYNEWGTPRKINGVSYLYSSMYRIRVNVQVISTFTLDFMHFANKTGTNILTTHATLFLTYTTFSSDLKSFKTNQFMINDYAYTHNYTKYIYRHIQYDPRYAGGNAYKQGFGKYILYRDGIPFTKGDVY